MINSLAIKNFQSHKDTVLSFTDGINVITGSSDSGKSAILRALYWVIENRPSGESYRTLVNGNVVKEDTEVVLSIDNNTVTRAKGNTNNFYKVNDLRLDAFGTSVPEEVSKAVGIIDINVQKQFDKAFLIDETPGKIAETFNKVANLEIIDITLKNLKSALDDYKRQSKNKEENIKQLFEKFEQFKYLEPLEKDVNALYEQAKELEQKELELDRLKYFINKINTINIQIKSLPEYEEVEQALVKIEEDIKKGKELQNELVKLKRYYNTIDELENKLTKLESISVDIDLDKLEADIKTLNKKEEELTKLKRYYNTIDKMEKEIELKDVEIDRLEKELKEIMPEVCPICGSKIDAKITNSNKRN